MDVVVGLALEGFQLAGAHLELVHVLAEMPDVIPHRRGETLSRIDHPFEAALQVPEQRVEGVELDPAAVTVV